MKLDKILWKWHNDGMPCTAPWSDIKARIQQTGKEILCFENVGYGYDRCDIDSYFEPDVVQVRSKSIEVLFL